MKILFLILSKIILIMPHTLRLKLGSILGLILSHASPRRMHIAKKNLALCFPDCSEKQRHIMLNAHSHSIGQGMLEALMAWTFPPKYLSHHLEIDGEKHLAHALQLSRSGNRPILLLGLHSTSIELTPPFLNTVMVASGVYKPLRNTNLNEFVLKKRLHHAEKMFTQNDMRGMLAHLQSGKHLWYASDQDFGLVAKGEYAEFFGHPAHTLTLYAKMANRTNAIVLPVGTFRDGNRYVMKFLEILSKDEYDTPKKAASTVNSSLEKLCKGFEYQYYWVHRRFKTQDDGKKHYED